MHRTGQRTRRPGRRLIAAGVSGVLLATLAACSTETSTQGERPHRPVSAALPTPNPEINPDALAVKLSSLPGWTAPTKGTNGTWTRPMVDGKPGVTWEVLDQQNKVIPNYSGPETVAFGDPSTYTTVPGVLTFRGNNYRNGGAYGHPKVTQKKLEVVWSKDVGEIRGEGSYWPGAGWTGQPLLVQWPTDSRAAMGFAAEFASKADFVEVLYPVFGGKIHRLDLATGKDTKPAIDVGWGFKGTASVDPRGYPLLYAGQGLNDTNGTVGPWGFRMFDLIQNKEVYRIPGLDPGSPRPEWGAFDSSTLVNRQTDTLIEPAENGLVYKVKLNTDFDAAAKKIGIKPEITKLRYAGPLTHKHGIENSAVAYRNLMFAADNDGNVLCWDATTLQIVWMTNVGDDTDSSIVLDETPEGVFLYTGNEVDTRGAKGGERITNIRKLDALTGKELWRYDIPTYYDAAVNGGVLGTPAVGQGSLGDMVIFTVARTTAPREGNLIALDKATGKVIWDRHMGNYSWSSPTLFTAADGTQYGVVTDSEGVIHLFDPNTGLDISTLNIGKNIEATPAIFNDMLVVASYDRHIYGIRIS